MNFGAISQVEQNLSDKVEVTHVLMQREHGLRSQARVSSLEAADAVLERWVNGAGSGNLTQCDVQIVFQDGFRYLGHFPLAKSRKRVSLARHVRKQLTALAAATDGKKPSQAADEPVISLIGSSRAESARIALAHYNI